MDEHYESGVKSGIQQGYPSYYEQPIEEEYMRTPPIRHTTQIDNKLISISGKFNCA